MNALKLGRMNKDQSQRRSETKHKLRKCNLAQALRCEHTVDASTRREPALEIEALDGRAVTLHLEHARTQSLEAIPQIGNLTEVISACVVRLVEKSATDHALGLLGKAVTVMAEERSELSVGNA